jgi:plasmid stabilization system protein ParE
MPFRVSLTASAESDAYQAFEYIQNDAPQRAEEWLIGLFQEIDILKEMPRGCPVIAESIELGREVRQLLCGPYRIHFDIQEETANGPPVRVHHIRHGARDRITVVDLNVP